MNTNFPDPAEISQAVRQIMAICRIAWEKGFMAGWSGNASMRLPENPRLLLITASGSPKGLLETDDCLLINLKGEKLAGQAKASSESRLHTVLYEAWPAVKAILHTHPAYLQALELAVSAGETESSRFLTEKFLNVNLHEALIWRGRLHFAANYPPGSAELAQSAVKAVLDNMDKQKKEPALPLAIWLPFHGLCAMGKTLKDCLCLTEEFEHLARVQLLGKVNL